MHCGSLPFFLKTQRHLAHQPCSFVSYPPVASSYPMTKSYAARRVGHLQESVIRSITRYAMEKGAVLLAQGFPDFDPPPEVIAAADEAMRQGTNQYGMTWGQPALRKAISQKSLRFYGQSVDPERHVTVTCGVTEAVIAGLVAIVNPGERVIVLEPAHENYHAGIA